VWIVPKGDADNLRADLDDGYAKVARLFLEALSCAPLTGTEYAVTMFIMRRTYGWAKGENRDTGKLDVMTARDIARGTGRPARTVDKALGDLVKMQVLHRVPLRDHPGAQCAYGMNCDIEEWGSGPDWRDMRTTLREARQEGTYTRNHVVGALPEITYSHYAKSRKATTRKRVERQALSPTATGAPEPLQQSLTAESTEKGIAPAVADALPDWQEATTGQAKVTLRAWSVFGFPGVPAAAAYKAVGSVVRTYAEKVCLDWIGAMQELGRTDEANGADPATWLCSQLRAHCKPDRTWVWEKELATKRGNGSAPTAPSIETYEQKHTRLAQAAHDAQAAGDEVTAARLQNEVAAHMREHYSGH
jgi:phage replication O-like protein O